MAKEICISSTPHETRLAILEDDQLAEIYYERENEYTLAGSIYNGRVTRVLPGMQSAFVDVGLERDAFLYVTDFLELEDPEETDELEKAAASGGNQPPREVRHTNAPPESNKDTSKDTGSPNARREPRADDRSGRGNKKPEQKQEPRQERSQRDRRPEPAPTPAPETLIVSEETEDAEQDSGAAGTRRWRGRRRRRGGRGPGGAPGGPESTSEIESAETEISSEAEVAPEIHASAAQTQVFAPAPRAPQVPVAPPTPFVLPGESLSRYGGVPSDDAPKSAAPAPARPASSFKPATLIDSPLEWDGSGLLPGESLSKHRNRHSEPVAEVAPEPFGVFSDAVKTDEPLIGEEQATDAASDFTEEEYFVEEFTESASEFSLRHESEETQEEHAEEAAALDVEEMPQAEHDPIDQDDFEETTELAPASFASEPPPAEPVPIEVVSVEPQERNDYAVETVIEQPSADEPTAAPLTRQEEVVAEPAAESMAAAAEPAQPNELDADGDEPPSDASASHHIDSVPPTGFRLFGLGGKKKAEPAPPAPEPKPATVAAISTYAPGSGLIEEEVIEGEEFDAPHHHGKADEHDLDEFEEETLPTQARSGDLGELLQEAHLDHRIQLNFDEKGEEDESFDDDDSEDEEESPGEGQPVAAPGQETSQQRRDRNGRNRRGRGGQQGQQSNQGNRRGGPSRRSAQLSDLPVISDLLKPGQEILVQIAKEPIAKKGARITSHIALPGRFLVFMPTVSHIGVSRKIASDEERQRLKRILVHERGEASGGFIVRTAAEGASEEELRADLRMLIHLWSEIKQRSDSSNSPALIYHDLGLIERILRDQISDNFSSIWVDSEADYERIVRFLNRVSPSLVRRVKLYTKELPLFEHFGIQDEISKALRSKVWLKSGGSIVINQTEALVAIDINTGKYVGKSARLEDTIVKTNLDAVPEIVRQIRLRDLGGIIVIDFIDMDERKNRFRVLAALEEALKSDRAPTKVLQFNDFGLVAITRKRVKQSLERTLSVPCATCQATGMVKSPTTVCNEIYTELRKMKKHFEGADVLLRVHPETVKVLKQNNASWLTEFEELTGKNILVKSDATLHPEQFDIQG